MKSLVKGNNIEGTDMTVKELKELLNKFDEDEEVNIALYSGPTNINTVEEEVLVIDAFGREYYAFRENEYQVVDKKKVVMLTGDETE